MSIINLFKRNKQPILRPMDDNIYRLELKMISKGICIDTSLTKEENILDAEEIILDEILGQVLITKYSKNCECIEYFKELATGKLIPICYIKEFFYNRQIIDKWLQDSSPIYVKYKEIVDNRNLLEIFASKIVEKYYGMTIEDCISRHDRENIASLNEIKKYLQERRPNGDSSVFLTTLNGYFEQAEEYYRLAEYESKVQEYSAELEKEQIKQIVKSINKKYM